jgi:uncharacterized membrane protein
MVFLELIGIPRYSWATVLFLAVPATAIGVFAGTVLEQWLVAWLEKRDSR